MNRPASLTRSLFSLVAALGVLGSVACGGITTDEPQADLQGKGDQSQQGTDGSVDGSTVHPTPHRPTDPDAPAEPPVDPTPEPVSLAQAHTRAQLEAIWAAQDDSGYGTGGGPTPQLDPNDLFLEVSDMGVQCSASYVSLPCGGHWSASIGVPPSLQKVGVYDLNSPELSQYSHMSETAKEPNSPAPDDCAWGGGSFGGGTLEILAIDDTRVTFRIDAKGSFFFEADPSGTYTALRCK